VNALLQRRVSARVVDGVTWFGEASVFKSGLPALYVRREFTEIGGLMSFGVPYRDMCRTVADYIFFEARKRETFSCSCR
jgi:hypothetical protein